MSNKKNATTIINESLKAVMPEKAVVDAISTLPEIKGKLIVIAVGKAAWSMSKAASKELSNRIDKGLCITKYGHVIHDLQHFTCIEAGHPVPDENSYLAAKTAEKYVENLTEDDMVLFLLSGGASALFEDSIIEPNEMQYITEQLLSNGADIRKINTIRKHLSAVKGGRFAQQCSPAKVYSIILSDIIGDPLDMIGSGPTVADSSTCREANEIVEEYHLILSKEAKKALQLETPKYLENTTSVVWGSVSVLCKAAMNATKDLGYKTVFLTSSLQIEASEAGKFLGSIAREHSQDKEPIAFICGGETTVHLRGKGKGGRNTELVLSAAMEIEGLSNVTVFSIGSDGTDGPTDAAGGIVGGESALLIRDNGKDPKEYLKNNDSYHALEKCDGLIITGPTGTNVNDLSVVLVDV